ncbi:holo-ACP synthase [Oceanobacter mangrovi]|uniref:holo-ACP synthase n=1 Tax=Oceanobacter mangrovi TaxID=2862510 RepID=UPI001C8E4936|nr:holo-ACP synthase [Oceanobacter mangrovi]
MMANRPEVGAQGGSQVAAQVVGIGTDMIRQQRVAAVYQRKGERFVQRILTAAEQQLWQQRGGSENFLAKQYAAKEAIAKALGTGIAKGVGFQQIEVLRDAHGAPLVRLYDAAEQRLFQLGGQTALLSLTDDGGLILAFAVLSR